jgi:streptogramin lyase
MFADVRSQLVTKNFRHFTAIGDDSMLRRSCRRLVVVTASGALMLRAPALIALAGSWLMAGAAWAQIVTEFSAGITPGVYLQDIKAGPDGNLWFTEYALDKSTVVYSAIAKITPQGVVTEFTTGLAVDAQPTSIATGPDGNLWFTEFFGNRIGRITPQGVVTEFSVGISPGAGLSSIAAGVDGNLWFTESYGHAIGRITPAGVVTEFDAGVSANPGVIAAGPDGNMWFTDAEGNRIGRVDVNGNVTSFSAGIAAAAFPEGIAAGPEGNLWFTESANSAANPVPRIGRIMPSGAVTEFGAGITAGASPPRITAGPDGNLWFTDFNANRISRITPAGAVTEFSAGSAAFTVGVTTGPDGNVWFTYGAPTRVARITIPPPVLQSAVSRKVHGSAGTFDLPLSLVDIHNPTTESRQGTFATIVMTFDAAITSASAVVSEGVATAGAPTFNGSDVIVNLSGVMDQQYLTLALTNVISAGVPVAGASVRMGFLTGDVNHSRTVTVADLGLVNAQLTQPVSASNYLMDVNASGTLTLADKGITNVNLTHSLPPP